MRWRHSNVTSHHSHGVDVGHSLLIAWLTTDRNTPQVIIEGLSVEILRKRMLDVEVENLELTEDVSSLKLQLRVSADAVTGLEARVRELESEATRLRSRLDEHEVGPRARRRAIGCHWPLVRSLLFLLFRSFLHVLLQPIDVVLLSGRQSRSVMALPHSTGSAPVVARPRLASTSFGAATAAPSPPVPLPTPTALSSPLLYYNLSADALGK